VVVDPPVNGAPETLSPGVDAAPAAVAVRFEAEATPRVGVTSVQLVTRQTLPLPLEPMIVSATTFDVLVQKRKPVAAAEG
jgi:hypothetical protein